MAERGQAQSRLLHVLRLIDEAVGVTKEAENARQSGDEKAGAVSAAAEQFHYRVLKLICTLSDSEADLAEPALTALENRLFRLNNVLSVPRAS